MPNGASTTTDDERHFVVKGRRWRRTDPSIPETLRQQLVDGLMDARRAVKAAKASGVEAEMRSARARVQDAKVALGERGQPPWWETPTDASLDKRLTATIRCLLQHRDAGKTVCPSEAARVVGGSDWRGLMARTRDVAWRLEEAGWLVVTQRGERVRPPVKGAIRLRRVEAD